jgi:hypothetical protein
VFFPCKLDYLKLNALLRGCVDTGLLNFNQDISL